MRILALVLPFTFCAASAFAAKLQEFKPVVAAAYLYHPTGPDITYFRATWTVPAAPAFRNTQDIAIWPGLQPEDSRAVLQPVLQWGSGWANGGSEGWALSCWGVIVQPSDEVTYRSSPLAAVQEGDEVTAVMELVSKDNGNYTYKCYFEGYPETELIFEAPSKLNTAWLEYEIQGLESCEDYSDNVVFTDVQLKAGKKNLKAWEKLIEDPKTCGVKVGKSKNLGAGGSLSINVR